MTWKFKKTRKFEQARFFEEFDHDLIPDVYEKPKGIVTGTDDPYNLYDVDDQLEEALEF